MRAPLVFLAPLAVSALVGCSSSSSRGGFDNDAGAPTPPGAPAPTASTTFAPTPPGTPPPDAEINEIYGHSDTVLYKLDPKTNAVSVVANFQGCDSVIDIALDGKGKMYATSFNALYTVDKATAACTVIGTGTFPNSLSFVPKGTVDPDEEALVGYEDSDYVRISITDGTKTRIGSLGGGFRSSGDIVSVKGGSTYLTVKSLKGSQCMTTDCLVEVNPATGAVVKDWHSIEHADVFGLAFWGGKVYGFDKAGEVFEVTFGATQLATKAIPIPSAPTTLSFWGAGSSTSAPLVATPQ